MHKITKFCKQSGEEFLPKRENQLFANKANRVNYHNSMNNKLRQEQSLINKRLTKNLKIFNALLGNKDEVTANKHFLRGAGISFQNFTHVHQSKDGVVFGVYSILFHKLNEEEYLIYRAK